MRVSFQFLLGIFLKSKTLFIKFGGIQKARINPEESRERIKKELISPDEKEIQRLVEQ